MLYREIIAVCSEIHTERMNTLCGRNVELLGAFTKMSKATYSFSMFSVLLNLSIPMKQLISDWIGFHEV
jgi:hypothetical protein